MAEGPLQTVELKALVDRIQAGDTEAEDQLIRRTIDRLERLARKMLHRFPDVRRWEETADILQNASLRLLRALREVRPQSTRAFFALAAEQVRRELLDLCRHYKGPRGLGANHASGAALGAGIDDAGRGPGVDPPAPTDDDLDRWTEFHEAIPALPDKEREVFTLHYYGGCSQVHIAREMAVDERTVRRYWQSARLMLHAALGGNVPLD